MLTIRDILFASIDNQSPTTFLMKIRDKVNNSFLKTETTRDLLGLLLLSAILKIIMALFIGVINHDGVLYIDFDYHPPLPSHKRNLPPQGCYVGLLRFRAFTFVEPFICRGPA